MAERNSLQTREFNTFGGDVAGMR
ncbi:hypothetical protein A2U01_0028399, partial [Trifolium medium]|nr:hypothetical protein [Trifolium medium]